jgi:hypothetical protein
MFFLLTVRGDIHPAMAAPNGTYPQSANTSPVAGCVPDWGEWPSPNVGSGRNQLMSVAALSTSDVWAVGGYMVWPLRPIIQHWNGTEWSAVPVPDLGGAAVLWSVAATSPNNVWAVGYYDSGNRRWRALILRWNGTAWAQVPTPNVGTGSAYLFGVTAIAANDAWAVGSSCCVNYQQQTLVLHWDGTAWTQVPSPSIAPLNNSLYAVSGVASNDVWAVGAYGAYDNRQTLIEHWDGAQWSVSGTSRAGTLLGVTALSPDKGWAVGYGGSSFSRQTLIMRLTQSGWEVAPSPSPGNQDNILYDVAAIAEDDIWAVGTYRNAYKTSNGAAKGAGKGGEGYITGQDETLIVHWDGGRWTVVPSPNREYEASYLYGIAVVSVGEMWAVGETQEHYYDLGQTFIARYAGQAHFSDVWASDYFYEAVRYLYCAGVISGYGDGSFRPYNNTTRGQLSKIVVLGEGWPLACDAGHFSDVPPNNPFFCYIETAYAHGVVSGYSDGTFRPGNNVTRGQLSKIIVSAEGWPLVCPPVGHFSDVPPSNPFYCFIETAFSHGVISGYSDGTFQPGSNATRGQISKIIYTAIAGP